MVRAFGTKNESVNLLVTAKLEPDFQMNSSRVVRYKNELQFMHLVFREI